MSQFLMIPSHKPHLEVFSGWDPILKSFILFVEDNRVERGQDGRTVCFLGYEDRQLFTIEDLLSTLCEFGNPSETQINALVEERKKHLVESMEKELAFAREKRRQDKVNAGYL